MIARSKILCVKTVDGSRAGAQFAASERPPHHAAIRPGPQVGKFPRAARLNRLTKFCRADAAQRTARRAKRSGNSATFVLAAFQEGWLLLWASTPNSAVANIVFMISNEAMYAPQTF